MIAQATSEREMGHNGEYVHDACIVDAIQKGAPKHNIKH